MSGSAPRDWDGIAEWWGSEVGDDPVYREDVAPLLDRLTAGAAGPMLELGCGEGQWLRHLGPSDGVFGTDSSHRLLNDARKTAPVARGVLPDLGWLRDDSLGTAFSLFVLDLIEDHERFFVEAARVVCDGGALVVIINHPAFTAPGSGPFMDEDMDVFWRWGTYLRRGESPVPAGDTMMTMYHRSTADLLTTAADSGWALEEMIEAPLGLAAIDREPSYIGQEGIPRFLGARWRRG
ncbi:MAG: methyltransferase domain-containing protein [Actinomycetota bacterium]